MGKLNHTDKLKACLEKKLIKFVELPCIKEIYTNTHNAKILKIYYLLNSDGQVEAP